MANHEVLEKLMEIALALDEKIDTAKDDLALARELGQPLTDLESKLATIEAKRDLILLAVRKRLPDAELPKKEIAAGGGDGGGKP